MKIFKLHFYKENSVFFWLILITIICVLSVTIYSKNRDEQSKKIKSSLENIYLKKIVKEITENLKPRYTVIEYTSKSGDTYQNIINKLDVKKSEKQIVIDTIKKEKALKLLKINQKFNFKLDNLTGKKVIEFVIETDKKNQIVFKRIAKKKTFISKKIKKNFIKKLVYKETVITNSLYNSAINLGIKPNIIIEFARLYGFQVDFQRDVWKNNFRVSNSVLIPRPETEQIIEEVLKLTNFDTSKNFLDIGTGSGCIILSILKERPKCLGTALDISKKALKVALFNAKMHHLLNKIKFVNIDIDKFNHNKYDFIISNPPYINDINLKRLDKDVRLYEPLIALKAGIDGLSAVKKIILKSKKLLKNNGKLIIEIGNKQITDVIKLLNKNSFYINKVCKDIQSYPRVIVATKIF